MHCKSALVKRWRLENSRRKLRNVTSGWYCRKVSDNPKRIEWG